MEDLKPPYVLPHCSSPPFIWTLRTLTPYRRRWWWRTARRAATRETGTIFFSATQKPFVSATDVWFGYPRKRRFKEAENWPDASYDDIFIRDVNSLDDVILIKFIWIFTPTNLNICLVFVIKTVLIFFKNLHDCLFILVNNIITEIRPSDQIAIIV